MTSGDLTQHQTSPIVRFYLGTSTDSERRSIHEIWDWDRAQLERTHDYIQWLFPLQTRSAFSPEAPILSESDIAAFRESDELRARLRKSLETMLRFYGLRLSRGPAGDPVVEEIQDAAWYTATWLAPNNHNHLRLTRILTSASTLGLRDEALALQRWLINTARSQPASVTRRTADFWERAVSRS